MNIITLRRERYADAPLETRAKLWLWQRFPKAFGPDHIPLMLGIHRPVLAARPPFSGNDIRRVIRMRAHNDKYLMAMIARDEDGRYSAMRHDLDGVPVGPVSPAHVAAAKREFFDRRRARAREVA